jgi:hypothetical protein
MNKNVISILLISLVSNAMQAQQQLTNLPTFYITTTNATPVRDKTTWVPGHITIVGSDASENLDMDLEIRGRGNSTWNLSKKPYRIKLASKTKLLGMPAKDKDWVLLANHSDKTLIRNALAFHISELIGMEYTVAYRFADVYLNGQYIGNYQVTDQVEVAGNRVPVEEQEPADVDLPNLAGGYLVEIDGFGSSEPVHFTTAQSLIVTVKYPDDDDINSQQKQYIQDVIQNFEDVLFSADFTDPETGYRALVDTNSLINWYISCELTGDPDCFYSTYIYKKRDSDKLIFGPLWDKDIAFNNCNRKGDLQNKLMREDAYHFLQWIQRIWQDDWFKRAVNRRWIELKDNDYLNHLLQEFIDDAAYTLSASQQQNFTKWNVLNTRVYDEWKLFPTYQGGVDFLKTYIIQRINFLTTSFANTLPAEPTPPFEIRDFYYRIVNEQSNNAIDVKDNSLSVNANLEMWSPIEEDSSQLWKIIPLSNNEFQFINLRSNLAITGSGKNNSLLQTSPDNTLAEQRWKITPVFTGNLYGIENNDLPNNYSVNNSGGSTANGTRVIEYDNNIFLAEKRNQHWYFEEAIPIPQITALSVVKEDKWIIYPNPVQSELRIKNYETAFGAKQLRDGETVEIFDIAGHKMRNSQLSILNSQLKIDVSDLPSGIYLLKIGNERGKFIKK